MIKLEKVKIEQARRQIARIQDGLEKGAYVIKEAKPRIDACRKKIDEAQEEIDRLSQHQVQEQFEPDLVRKRLAIVRARNIEAASFEQKRELLAILNIKVMPSEDLKTRKISCNLGQNKELKEVDGQLYPSYETNIIWGVEVPKATIDMHTRLEIVANKNGFMNKSEGYSQAVTTHARYKSLADLFLSKLQLEQIYRG